MEKTLVEKLTEASKKFNSIACFGMDPLPEKIPFGNGFEPSMLYSFFRGIFDEMEKQGVFPGAVKPNEGFYSRHDGAGGQFDGSKNLRRLVRKAHELNLPVIFDAKKGDIGRSSKNYAEELTEVWDADVLTVSPYMGTDSVEPFIKARAAYVLCRTSNDGAKDFQNLVAMDREKFKAFCKEVDNKNPESVGRALENIAKSLIPVYMHVAHKIANWYDLNPGNVGAVVGATSLDELKEISACFVASKKPIPLLIPGVGKQGGSGKDVAAALRSVGYDLSIVRINSSSELNFAWEKEGKKEDYAGASVRALKKLNEEIGYKA